MSLDRPRKPNGSQLRRKLELAEFLVCGIDHVPGRVARTHPDEDLDCMPETRRSRRRGRRRGTRRRLAENLARRWPSRANRRGQGMPDPRHSATRAQPKGQAAQQPHASVLAGSWRATSRRRSSGRSRRRRSELPPGSHRRVLEWSSSWSGPRTVCVLTRWFVPRLHRRVSQQRQLARDPYHPPAVEFGQHEALRTCESAHGLDPARAPPSNTIRNRLGGRGFSSLNQ